MKPDNMDSTNGNSDESKSVNNHALSKRLDSFPGLSSGRISRPSDP